MSCAIFGLTPSLLQFNSFTIAIFFGYFQPKNTQKTNSQHQKLHHARNLYRILDLAKINEKSRLSPYVPSGLAEGQKEEFTTCFVLSPKKDKFRHALSFCKIMIMTPISSSKVNIFRKNHIPSWFYLPKTFDFFIIRTNLPSA